MKRLIAIITTLITIIVVVVATLVIATQCIIPGICAAQNTFNATTILDKVQNLSALTTTRYTFSTIVTVQSEMPSLLQALYGQKQVMVAVGYITAGIDMTQAQIQNAAAGDGFTLMLPAPTLQDCILDEGKTYIAALEQGIFAPSNPTIDQETRRFAVQQLRQSAVDGNILVEAQTQAQVAVGDFLELVGVPNVQIAFAPASPNTPLPESCV